MTTRPTTSEIASADPSVVPADGGRYVNPGPFVMRVIEDGSNTSGTHALVEFTISGSFSPPPHIHHQHDEIIYVLEGELAMQVRGDTVIVGAGEAFATPVGLPHTFSRHGATTLRFLLTISPASHLAYFESVAEAIVAARGVPGPQVMMGVMERYGLEPIRPS